MFFLSDQTGDFLLALPDALVQLDGKAWEVGRWFLLFVRGGVDLFDHTEIGGEVKMYSLYSYQLADQAFGNGIRKLHEQTNYAC